MRALDHSSAQKKILKEHKTQTTARNVSVVYRLWLPFSINSAQLKKVKKCNIPSICRQQLLRSFTAYQHSLYQKKVLKDQAAKATARDVSLSYRLWLPVLINSVLNLTKLRSIIYDQSLDISCFGL